MHSSSVVGTGEMPRTLHRLCQEVTLSTSVPYVLLNCSTIASLSPRRTVLIRRLSLSSGRKPKTSHKRLNPSITGSSGLYSKPELEYFAKNLSKGEPSFSSVMLFLDWLMQREESSPAVCRTGISVESSSGSEGVLEETGKRHIGDKSRYFLGAYQQRIQFRLSGAPRGTSHLTGGANSGIPAAET